MCLGCKQSLLQNFPIYFEQNKYIISVIVSRMYFEIPVWYLQSLWYSIESLIFAIFEMLIP